MLADAPRRATITCPAEDDALTDSHELVKQRQRLEFAFLSVALQPQLLDSIDRDILLFQIDLIRFRCNAFCKVANPVGEGGREEDNLGIPRESAERQQGYDGR